MPTIVSIAPWEPTETENAAHDLPYAHERMAAYAANLAIIRNAMAQIDRGGGSFDYQERNAFDWEIGRVAKMLAKELFAYKKIAEQFPPGE